MSRVSDIRYVGYAVPDLAAEREFYRDKWGLREVAEHDGMVYFATEGDDKLYVVRLRHAPEKRIDVIALAAESKTDVDTLFTKVRDAGCSVIFAPKNLDGFGGGYGIRFFARDGLPFEIPSDVQPGTARGVAPREALPEKISHIVMHSPDHKAATRFFVDVLGFRVSDWLPGPPCLNHVAYEMSNVDAMMRGIAKLRRKHVELRWGPGRHTAGNNTFSYFVTPNGFMVEYTSELERIDEATWQPTVYPPEPELMDQWGIGVGGPQNMPHAEPDKGLFQAADR